MIDFSYFKENHAVIHCKSLEEANELFKEMREFHPEYMRAWREDGASASWALYGKETCYCPVRYGDCNLRFEYCSADFYKDEGYKVLEFQDVVFEPNDFGVIPVCEAEEFNLLGII